jgi:transposase
MTTKPNYNRKKSIYSIDLNAVNQAIKKKKRNLLKNMFKDYKKNINHGFQNI